MVINHNIEADFTNTSLGITNKALAKSTEKLSSGYRINRAADDASGLSVSEGMRAQIRGLNRGAQNTSEAIQFCQVTDGAMQELENIVHRMRELSVQAANDTNTEEDRMALQDEVEGLIKEVNRITDDTEYNTIKVFGKSRMRTTYDTAGGTKLIPVETIITNVTGSNYGITEVLGKDHVHQSTKMDDPLEFTGTGWHHTIPVPSMRVSNLDANGRVISSRTETDAIKFLNKEYGISVSKTSTNETDTVTVANGDRVTLKYGAPVLGNGERVLNGFSVSTYDSATSTWIEKRTASGRATGLGVGTPGFGSAGKKYGSAWFDFSGLGTDYGVESLYGQSFNTVCSHGCGCHYNITFTGETQSNTTADGTNYTYSTPNDHKVLEINISGCTSGADIVKKVLSAANAEAEYTNHRNQFAYNDSEPDKLYIYDATGGCMNDKFQPVAWTGTGSSTQTVITWIEVPNTTLSYKWEDYDLNIQVGSNSQQMVELKRPYLNADVLGLTDLNLVDREDGGVDIRSASIGTCDNALDILNMWRSHIGALSNRFEHAYDNNLNSHENIQSSESSIRDLDMADEMVKFSSSNIIQQAAQAMLAQTNGSKEGILAMLS